ncbi:MAG: DNA mismatch repair protein MutS [Nitrospinae bacterium]|nr:DNA mismatch repair protein MutS [Nitrospinota bacterium]
MSDEASRTPLMRQYLGIKRNYPDCVLFFRMGDFYEMFFDDARTASRALNIALTSRDREGDAKTPMCGIPYHALESYLAKMVGAGHKVAICEQMEDPKAAKGVVRREVIRVVTPGTVTEDYLLDEKRANYLAAVAVGPGGAGLSTADLSTGRFTAREFAGPKWLDALVSELARIQPGEILASEGVPPGNPLFAALDGLRLEKMDPLAFDEEEARKTLASRLGVATLDGFGLGGKGLAVSSAGAILWYVKKNSPDALNSLDSIVVPGSGDKMELDPATLRNLEILQNLSDGGREGTLLDALDGTRTPMGARLLRERLVKPLVNPGAIMERQGLLTSFFENQPVREEFLRQLRDVGDFERCMGRLAGKNYAPRDFSSLLASLKKLPLLQKEAELLRGGEIKKILDEWDNLGELAELLAAAVNPGHPAAFKEPGFIRSGYSAELDGLRAFRENFMSAIRSMEAAEREATGVNSLKIGYNKIYGYYIEMTNKHSAKAPPHYIRKQSLVNCERYVSPELKEMEEKLLSSEERIRAAEDSTYLRQVALAALMAQAGGYVAAKRARIGAADRIFTRVGAQDRLQKGLSTFMVEMVETANILNNATAKSLVILDEIGRGTSTFDGVSIAWAVSEFLARAGARTIFATHYHELADLALTEPGVSNHNVSVREYRERLVFLRKVEPGPADKSYGIQVARLAGLPKEVLARARAVLRQLEKMEFGADGTPFLKGADSEEGPQTFLFFDARRHPAVDALRDADPNSMTPLEAMNFLQKLKGLSGE